MMLSKTMLRKDLRIIRQAFVSKRLNQIFSDQSLVDNVLTLANRAKALAGYVRTGSEVDPGPILAAIGRSATEIALPYLGGRSAPMQYRHWHEREPLERSEFGFLQPGATAAIVTPDMILVPLVGFDRNMNRLGQGAGHYDRAFARDHTALRIGLAWSCQEIDAVPVDPWDVPLDAILTEKEWIVGANSRIAA